MRDKYRWHGYDTEGDKQLGSDQNCNNQAENSEGKCVKIEEVELCKKISSDKDLNEDSSHCFSFKKMKLNLQMMMSIQRLEKLRACHKMQRRSCRLLR